MSRPVGRPTLTNGPSGIMDETIVQPARPPSCDRSNRWMFTLNNYTETEFVTLTERLNSNTSVQYYVIGREIAPTTGTRHLQGFILLSPLTRLRFTSMITLCGIRRNNVNPIHFMISTCRKVADAAEYCKKDNAFIEHGVLDIAPVRAPRNNVVSTVASMIRDGEITSIRQIIANPDYDAYYRSGISLWKHLLSVSAPRRPFEPLALKLWQGDLYNRLRRPACDRKVLFVVDPVGNSGKTWFHRYYCYMHPDEAKMLPVASCDKDMAYNLRDHQGISVLFIDIARSENRIPYAFTEGCKDGTVPCGKYDFGSLEFQKHVHVVVFMNRFPDMTALSGDRYDIFEIDDRNNRLPVGLRPVVVEVPDEELVDVEDLTQVLDEIIDLTQEED